MSNNIVPIDVVRADYPLTRMANRRVWAVLKGSGETSYQEFPSTNFNNNQIVITCNPPSNKTIINRVIFLEFQALITFQGPDSGTPLLQLGSTDALRCQPLAAVTNTIAVQINNDSFTTNLNQYWYGLQHYHNTIQNRDKFLSMTPSFPDKSQQYDTLVGSVRNPLGDYASSADGQLLRGAFSDVVVISNSNTLAQVAITVTEPIFMSPFLFSSADNMESGLVGVDNMNIVLSLGDLSRLWSHANNGNPFSAQPLGVAALVTSCTALFNYCSPVLTAPVPREISWPYSEITSYPQTQQAALAAGDSTTVTLNAVQIKCIPEKLYIFAKRSQQTETFQTTDCFARINSITLTFGTRVGLLSTANIQELYQLSLKNGLNMNYTEFTSQIGSVLCLKWGEDVGINAISAPGMLDNQQLTLNVNITNIGADPVFYTLYMVVVNPGTVSMVDRSFMHQVGVVTAQDILNLDAPGAPSVPYQANNQVYGGAWYNDIANFFRGVRDKIKPYVSPLADIAQLIPGPHLAALGVARKLTGLGRKKRSKKLSKRVVRRSSKKRRGGTLVGGELMDHSLLRSRLMRR